MKKAKTMMQSEEWSKQVDQPGCLPVYQLRTTTIQTDEVNKIQVLGVGPVNKEAANKSMLLLGETGAGKTSAINTMVNFLYGVSFTDTFRFRLNDQQDDDESRTDYITMFVIYHQPGMSGNCNYFLVEIPGFSETQGIDNEMKERLTLFLTKDYKVDVNCIGIIAKENDNRKTQATLEILESIKSSLGEDVECIISLLVTFARDGDNPRIVSTLESCGIILREIYKLDNPHGLYKFNKGSTLESRWKYTNGELARFFHELQGSLGVKTEQTRRLSAVNTDLKNSKREIKKCLEDTVKDILLCKSNERSLTDVMSKHTLCMYELLLANPHYVHFHRCSSCEGICGNICRDTTWGEAFAEVGFLASALSLGIGPAHRKISGNCPAMSTKNSLFCNHCKHYMSEHSSQKLQELDCTTGSDYRRRNVEVKRLKSNEDKICLDINTHVDELANQFTKLQSHLSVINELSYHRASETLDSIIEDMRGATWTPGLAYDLLDQMKKEMIRYTHNTEDTVWSSSSTRHLAWIHQAIKNVKEGKVA